MKEQIIKIIKVYASILPDYIIEKLADEIEKLYKVKEADTFKTSPTVIDQQDLSSPIHRSDYFEGIKDEDGNQ